MKITGIICEYNPLHLGHAKQIQIIRQKEPDTGIVCLMSGNYVQRGMPAIFDKQCRSKAAICCGADLVLELPVTASLSSAEGFAAEGVRILAGFCDTLSFGAEDANTDQLLHTAHTLLQENFTLLLKDYLATGLSFPAARQKALEATIGNSDILKTPNNILAIEYCKALLLHNYNIRPEPILRQGNYHDTVADAENPSATAVRQLLQKGECWKDYIPKEAVPIFENAPVHTLEAGEKAILYRLRTMKDSEYEALPYGSEGLWRKFMKNARQYATLEEILTATKSKRYTRTRLDRMAMCAFLGINGTTLQTPAPYSRVLALNDRGRDILRKARESGSFPNIGEKMDHPYQQTENRWDDLYGLFAVFPESPGITRDRRVYYHQ